MTDHTDTIFALSTPVGGAIAVIRASGPRVGEAARSLTGKDLLLTPRMMVMARLRHEGAVLDEAMAACFCGPNSYTGEDMLELYCHGSQAVVRAVGDALLALGLRPAEAGELTRRAFLNGKMDLVKAEAVMDLIQAEADYSARAALEQMRGRLSQQVERAEALLYEGLSAVNAAIDYPEELEEEVYEELPQQMKEAEALLTLLIEEGLRGRVLREGFRIVLLGAPNAGKSSLLNALVGYERAIVTRHAGTTRDTLEERVLIDGLPLLFIDTAGLREARDEAEQEGVLRARAAVEGADAVLLLLDTSQPLPEQPHLNETKNKPALLIGTKADLPRAWAWETLSSDLPRLNLSAKTGEGMDALLAHIKGLVGPVGNAYVTNQRHIKALQSARAALLQAGAARDADSTATDLREALLCLGSITGRAVDEEVIDQIFSRFCVGK